MKEDQHFEWKSSWRDEYLRWICGFANAEGGTLVVGKNDRGEVLGVPNAAKLLEDIPNKVRDILGMVVAVNLRREKGKDLLEIVVEPYPSPISYRGEYHVRSGSTKQELKGAALDKFLLQRYGRRSGQRAGAGVSRGGLQPGRFSVVPIEGGEERAHE